MGTIRATRGRELPAVPGDLSTERAMKGRRFRDRHHHVDHTGCVYVLKGQPRLEWGPGGHNSVDLAAGDYYVIDPNTIHREANPGSDEQVLIAFVVGHGPFVVEVDAPESECTTSR